MLEDIIVWIFVAAAVLFLLRHFRQSFSPKSNCGGGCSCSNVDWQSIEKQALQEKK
jgi:hypothetical protein